MTKPINLLLLLLLPFFAVAQIGSFKIGSTLDFDPHELDNTRQYRGYLVKEGYHSYIPGVGITFHRNRQLSKLEYSVVFDESSEYDWQGDLDQLDWNKGGGITFDWKRNDRDNIMWAWRYNADSSRYEFTVYVDWKYQNRTGFGNTKSKVDDVLMVANSGDIVDIDFIRQSGKKWYVTFKNMTQELETSGVVEVRVNPRWSRRIGPWFGGANNSPGRFGGVASQDMIMGIYYNAEN